MTTWHRININNNQVTRYTGRAYLINMPHNSDYDGYSFWHPEKMTMPGPHSAAMTVEFPEGWTFKLRKYSQRTHKMLDEVELNDLEMQEQFQTTSDNITAPKQGSYVEIKEPEYRQPTENKVDEELAL